MTEQPQPDDHPGNQQGREAWAGSSMAGDGESLGGRFLELCKTAGDLVFRSLVKIHPTRALADFRKRVKQIGNTGLIDSGWYREKHRLRPSEDPAHHYAIHGAELRFEPNPLFDTRDYVRQHPEVLAQRLNPLLHLAGLGKKMRRQPKTGDCVSRAGRLVAQYERDFARIDRSKKTILLISHDMSRTGAPILMLNMARSLRNRFNVIVLSLKGGALAPEYAEACDMVLCGDPEDKTFRTEIFLTELFRQILAKVPLTFVIANTIVSYCALKPLWNLDVPAIHLIHDFAVYFRPLESFFLSARYASLPVFSAKVVRDNVVKHFPEMARRAALLPQGINAAPGITKSPEIAEAERRRIIETFRPGGFPKETVVVLGIGTVAQRKGVDLFVACAKRVAEKRPRTPFRFVWIGLSRDWEKDEYSLFLVDQIERLGLSEIVGMMPEISELATAYEESDIFLMSSRLDPLPQVSQDAMACGRPVICFKDGTGTAEYLEENARAAYCVVPYLDLEETANRITRLIDDAPARREIGAACREVALRCFDFDRYVERLAQTGLELAENKARELADRELIRRSGVFRTDFYGLPFLNRSGDELLKQYLHEWRIGVNRRKPFPGFHPGVYAACHQLKERDPLAHYLEAGLPEGPWRCEVIDGGEVDPVAEGLRIALHLDLPDVASLSGILDRFRKVRTRLDLLVSVPSSGVASEIEKAAADWQGQLTVCVEGEEGGGPLFGSFGKTIVAGYDMVGHFHPSDSADPLSALEREKFFGENLIGGVQPMADAILGRMSADPKLGLVFPDDPNVSAPEAKSGELARTLARDWGIAEPPAESYFPTGAIFWARTAAIRPLLELTLEGEAARDAVARLLPLVCAHGGFGLAVTNVQGITR